MSQAPQFAKAGIAEIFRMLQTENARLVSIFGSVDEAGKPWVHYILDVDKREYRVLRVPADTPIPSATSITPAAAWYERELHDQFGIQVEGHPDLRPLLSS